MKNKTALKRSIVGLKVASVATAISGACFAVWTNWVTGAVLGFFLFHVVLDGWNILYIRRKAAKDPQFLEED